MLSEGTAENILFQRTDEWEAFVHNSKLKKNILIKKNPKKPQTQVVSIFFVFLAVRCAAEQFLPTAVHVSRLT